MHANIGILLASQSKLDHAIDQLNEAIRLDPNSERAHFNLGLVDFRLGRIPDAVHEFEETLRINPGNSSANIALAAAKSGIR